jgi:hypothetical protein
MHLKISARFTLADRPRDHRGLYSTTYRFGANGPLPFSQMCATLIREVSEWYCELEEPATLNHEIATLRGWLDGVVFEDAPADAGDGSEASDG